MELLTKWLISTCLPDKTGCISNLGYILTVNQKHYTPGGPHSYDSISLEPTSVLFFCLPAGCLFFIFLQNYNFNMSYKTGRLGVWPTYRGKLGMLKILAVGYFTYSPDWKMWVMRGVLLWITN
jgi:hypothetical protein